MVTEVDIYRMRGHKRSNIVCDAWVQGLAQLGIKVTERYDHEFRSAEAPVAVFYGFTSLMRPVMTAYAAPPRRAVYIDLGYWGRRQGGRYVGYHKVSVNSRHPVAYFRKGHTTARYELVGPPIAPWRESDPNDPILLAGMGAKGARAEGMLPEEWERRTIAEIKQHTGREIIYRPKPSWYESKPIEGTRFSPREEDVYQLLSKAHAVVTHHSNVAVEGIVAGVPAFSWGGVAQPMSSQDLSAIENPYRPTDRVGWAADIAWCQWSIHEMASGECWQYLRQEGLVP